MRTPTIALILAFAAAPALAGEVDLPRHPSVSPDGSTVAFTWRGDLWKAPTSGGAAVRLTVHPGNDLRSAWSPDGTTIAFESDRDGALNLYLMAADGSDVRQVTFADHTCILSAFTPDGRELLFQAAREGDVYRDVRPYRVPVAGGPITRVHGAFGRHPDVAPTDGRVVFSRGGSRWSRRHYRGPDARDVWLHDPADGSFRRLTQWKGNDGFACWRRGGGVVFLSDRELDTVNVYEMDAAEGGGAARRLTSFEREDVQSVDVSADGTTAVFVVWDTLYSLDLTQAGARPVAVRLTAPDDAGDGVVIKSVASSVSEARLSPDGKVLAYVAYGEIFVRRVSDPAVTRRVTENHAREKDLAWSPDGMRLYFVSDSDGGDSIYAATVQLTRGEVKKAFEDATKPQEPDPPAETKTDPEKAAGDAPKVVKDTKDGAGAPGSDAGSAEDGAQDAPAPQGKDAAGGEADAGKKAEKPEEKPPGPERWQDALRFEIVPIVQSEAFDRDPVPSPDGKRLAYRRGLGNMHVRELETGEDRRLVEGWNQGIEFHWSPDGRYIAYDQSDLDFNVDVFVIRADGSEPAVNVSRHPDGDGSPRWSADGKILAFLSDRVNEEYDVWMVYLDRDLEALTPEELDAYYKGAAAAAKKRKPLPHAPKKAQQEAEKKEDPEPLDLDDAYLRLRRVTSMQGSERNLHMTPAGDRFVFSATDTSPGTFTVKWDGKGLKRIGGPVSTQHLDLSGGKAVYVGGGRAGTYNPASGGMKPVQLSARMRVDLEAQSSRKFLEAARLIGEVFYHPTMKGLDWDAYTERYHELARRAHTADEFNWVAGRLLGELNASHLGVRSPGRRSPLREPNGRLGIDFSETAEGVRVERVLEHGPAGTGEMQLQVGDVITAVEDEPVGSARPLLPALRGRAGKETLIDVVRSVEDGVTKKLRVLLTPIASERALRYRDWAAGRARLVSEWSDGRLGYIHIRGMNRPALHDFERDLFAAANGKAGVILDVRNNGGGYTADLVLASISVRPHAYTIPRGADPRKTGHYPRDRLWIQRYTQPMNLLCNEKSFSNAEIFSHAFKTLERGTLVGQQTYGGVISTGGFQLVDGTFVRTPFRGWYLNDGTDMENNGAVPDIVVPQTPEAEVEGRDDQLREAVDDLLKRL